MLDYSTVSRERKRLRERAASIRDLGERSRSWTRLCALGSDLPLSLLSVGQFYLTGSVQRYSFRK